MAIAAVNGINLFYEIKGHGTPLVIINGLHADVSDFSRVADSFADNYQVLTFDNRGSGRSDKPDTPYSIDVMAEDTAGVIRTAGIESADIIGISMGGRIALALALNHPEVVRKLVLVSTSARVARPKTIRNYILFSVFPRLPILKGPYPQPYYAYKRQLAASAAYNCSDRLNEIHKPTLIAYGGKDKIVPQILVSELNEGIKDSSLAIFNGGHLFPLMGERQHFVEAVNSFLTQ